MAVAQKGVECGHILVCHHKASFASAARQGEDRFLRHRLVAMDDDVALADIAVGLVEAVEAVADAVLPIVALCDAAVAERAEPRAFLVAESGRVFSAAFGTFAVALAVGHGAFENLMLASEIPHPQAVASRWERVVHKDADFAIHVVVDDILPCGIDLSLAGVCSLFASQENVGKNDKECSKHNNPK